MSKQMTLGTGFERYSKTTRRERFLTEMDRIMPWGELCALIAPLNRCVVELLPASRVSSHEYPNPLARLNPRQTGTGGHHKSPNPSG